MTKENSQNATELREKLAAIQHEIWAHWMKYLFSVGAVRGKDGAHIIYPKSVQRWKRQMQTPYNKLSEEEKESDRHQADKVLAVVQGQLQEQFLRLGEELRRKTAECDKLRVDIASLLGELIEERRQRNEANALLLETAQALGLDSDDVTWWQIIDELPQKAAELREKAQKQSEAIQREWLSPVEAEGLRRKLEQTTRNALEANRRWKDKYQASEAVIEAGRQFWQEYATLADDLPDDMRDYFRPCSYLAGRFADKLREVNREEETRN